VKIFDDIRSSLAAGLLAVALICGASGAHAQGFTLPDGSAIQGHVKAMGAVGAAPPTAVGCTIGAGSTDFAGTCVTSAASGSITFQRTFAAAPSCLITDATATSTVSMPVYTVSATAITLSTVISAHTLYYICVGTQSST
jgi:hypothetical protein